ncbi:MAG: hypothetical protein RLZZ504_374 [Bacteroidota bacterium]
MPKNYSYIIQGAGASGLWLAYWMDREGLLANKTLLIIEGVTNKHNDRTWCFWTDESSQTFPFVDKHWTSLWVQGRAQAITPYRYCHARSSDFYTWIKSQLQLNANVHWHIDWVKQVDQVGDAVFVQTETASFKSDFVFHSGGLHGDANPSPISLWQSFVGWRVKLLHGSWQGDAATLMDFGIAQQGTTRFVYVLPISDQEGLVEITQFHGERLDRVYGEALLKQLCAARGWQVEVLEVECDAIPMSSMFNQRQSHHAKQDRIIALGVQAGALKPTTGYGFLSMRNHGRKLAQALKQNNNLPKIYRPWRFRFYDALLLQMLAQTPDRGAAIFERLFSRQPAHQILKFLNENTSVWEEVRLFSRLQVPWFLKALLKYVRQ